VSREWEVFDAARPLAATLYGSIRARMLVVGLGERRLMVVTPGRLDDARMAALAEWGEPAVLVAPNHFHHLGLRPWVERFPAAKVVAHERAIPRLRKQVRGVEFAPLESVALPAGVRFLCPPGARTGETWLSVDLPDGGIGWFVTDAILNETRLPPGLVGWVMWAIGFRTGLMTNPAFKRFFVPSKAKYKAWVLEQLERERPVLFVPAHGQILRGAEVVERLGAATRGA
jgi:hypothetical protein